MEMNPFKPLVQFCEELYVQRLLIRINKTHLKIRLAKATL